MNEASGRLWKQLTIRSFAQHTTAATELYEELKYIAEFTNNDNNPQYKPQYKPQELDDWQFLRLRMQHLQSFKVLQEETSLEETSLREENHPSIELTPEATFVNSMEIDFVLDKASILGHRPTNNNQIFKQKRWMPSNRSGHQQAYIYTCHENLSCKYSKDQEAQSSMSGTGDSVLADSILVSDGTLVDEKETDVFSDYQGMDLSFMAIITKYMRQQAIPSQAIPVLQQKHRRKTIRNYNQSTQLQSHERLNLSNDFVTLFTSHINIIKFSISSGFAVIYPKEPSIGHHHLVKDFFTGNKKGKVVVLNKEDIEIWDLDILLKYIADMYQQSIILSMALLLQAEHQKKPNNRQHLLTEYKITVVCSHPRTIANLVKHDMSLAGIDTTKYRSHAIHSAASTKAVQLGYSVEEFKKHSNWSLTSNTNLTENHTVSDVLTETKSIGVGANCNTTIDVVRTEDMVAPDPPTPCYSVYLD
ncbi:MAG: hypothetical protein EXX96DRAFT_619761 [Benjaminiella poitrasii]|nr:MAG: hypothetical protein EXX96DRAFT_619761 [Benjaminiella poitrasii]